MFKQSQVLTLFVAVLILAFVGMPMRHVNSQSQIDRAIQKLWSPSDAVRKEGLDELLRLGPASIDKLTSLFADLIHDQRPRFMPGKEQQGAKAFEEYIESARLLYSQGGDVAKVRAAKERVTALTLNARLMTDVVRLLGELKAEQAIPLLMDMVNRQFEITHLGLKIDTPETAALERIGAAAIPRLIENLNEATIRAYGFEPLAHGWRVVVDQEDDNEPDSVEELRHETYIGYVRLRVAVVLGDIGDTRSLPYLEKLLAQIKSSPESPLFGTGDSLSGAIENSISKIKKTGRWSEQRNANNSRRITLLPTSENDSGRPPSAKKPE
jgi:hypothetical protein